MSIVDKIKSDALRMAAEYALAVSSHQRRYRLERMADIVVAIDGRFDEAEGEWLAILGIRANLRGHSLVLRKRGWAMEIAPRSDMALSVNGTKLSVNPEFPLLTEQLYGEIKARIGRWAEAIDDGTAREVRQ